MKRAATGPKDDGKPATVAPLLPLAILESIRAHDRPREVLEDEDLAASLPRRLGLTGVVDAQIRHYEDARRRRRGVALEPIADLLRLVQRRADATDILREAGAGVARAHFRRVPAAYAALVRRLPVKLRLRAMRRTAAAMLRRVAGAGPVELAQPFTARIAGAVTARADLNGSACVLYESALEELVTLYTGRRPAARHIRCAGSGAELCEWELIA
jgi:bacteriochlorophyll 4-vinyl reductase